MTRTLTKWCTQPASVKRQEDRDDAEVETLVLAAQTGDPEAFGELYRLYYQRMFLWMRSNAPDSGDAEDLVQELFTRLLTELEEYEPREGSVFRAWLYGKAKLVMRRHVWGWVEQQRAADVEADRVLRGQDEPGAFSGELSPRVSSALECLTAGQRRYVELHFLDGLPRSTAAAVIGCTEVTVKSGCRKALAKLRPELADLASRRRQPAQPPEGSTVFTLPEAAVHSGRSLNTLKGAARERRLTTYWIGTRRVVTADDLAAYLDSSQPGWCPTATHVPAPRDGSTTRHALECAA